MREILPPYSCQDDIMRKVFVIVNVFVSFVPHRVAQKLLLHLRGDAVQRELAGNLFLQCRLGAEEDTVSLDLR